MDGRASAAATVDVAAFDPPPPADDTHNTESERRALQLYKPVSGFSESRLAGQTSQKGKSPINVVQRGAGLRVVPINVDQCGASRASSFGSVAVAGQQTASASDSLIDFGKEIHPPHPPVSELFSHNLDVDSNQPHSIFVNDGSVVGIASHPVSRTLNRT